MKLTRTMAGRRAPRLMAMAIAVSLSAGPVSQALAWDPATTQAGITERALLGSNFHRLLLRRLARPQGAFEPLSLHSRLLSPGERQSLWSRLQALDPAQGYRPDGEGVATALAWVTAGAVLAETPPERGRNHFLDPRTGDGLDDQGGLSGTFHALRLALDDGGSLRGLATGQVFDFTGQPSLRWVKTKENDLGLAAFESQLEVAVSAEEPAAREAALVRALMAMGGVVAALADAGEPAHVRNDFREAFLERQSASGWDRASRFERYVADRYGRGGVPTAKEAVRRPTFDSFFTAQDGQGLADRTQSRFFSDGTIPDDVSVDEATTPKEVVAAARASLPYPQPTITRLELKGPKQTTSGYLKLEGRRVLGYEWLPGKVRFFLDPAIYADSARVLLPEVTAYAAGMINHLFRAGLGLAAEGGRVNVSLEGVSGGKAQGQLRFYAEDSSGRRRALEIPEGRQGTFNAGALFSIDLPAGTRQVAAVLRGTDDAGSLVAVGELKLPQSAP